MCVTSHNRSPWRVVSVRLDAWHQGTEPHINFQGFMVGNAWTDAEIDNTGAVFDWWSHSLISEDTYVVPLCACTPRHVGAQVHVCGTPRGPQVQRRAEQLQHVRHRAPCDEHALVLSQMSAT